MANRILPEGLKWINMKGDIKAIAKHLASDVNLQKSLGFFPCDENGVAITQAEVEQVEVKKKDVEVAVEQVEPTVIIPQGSNIVNPLDEVEEIASENTEVVKAKRGRKPKTV